MGVPLHPRRVGEHDAGLRFVRRELLRSSLRPDYLSADRSGDRCHPAAVRDWTFEEFIEFLPAFLVAVLHQEEVRDVQETAD
jgi:hypothetical protein